MYPCPKTLRSDQAAAVRWLRERIGLSREQLAAASGVSAVHIKFIERGKRNPSEAVIQKLLPALRVSRRDLDGLLALRPWARSTASGDPATLVDVRRRRAARRGGGIRVRRGSGPTGASRRRGVANGRSRAAGPADGRSRHAAERRAPNQNAVRCVSARTARSAPAPAASRAAALPTAASVQARPPHRRRRPNHDPRRRRSTQNCSNCASATCISPAPIRRWCSAGSRALDDR